MGRSGQALSLGGVGVAQAHDSFKISLKGPFDARCADYLGDKLVHVETQQDPVEITTLFGHAIDLAAFLGTLHTLLDLGYPVVSFEYRQAFLNGRKSPDWG
jgi:hypothetical protein